MNSVHDEENKIESEKRDNWTTGKYKKRGIRREDRKGQEFISPHATNRPIQKKPDLSLPPSDSIGRLIRVPGLHPPLCVLSPILCPFGLVSFANDGRIGRLDVGLFGGRPTRPAFFANGIGGYAK
ncbi:hypothetical protein BLNAU_7250 [Blattamonas nauphoetae]|uniref:Uncharacterized protein n=1 Tax=Blattamonas nauphoetae TaxID=2049346 RepID=A0ABQ9Y258_9EUKA|nr:hypothetical protein BLNAU_7250 [Blattamonas nauphoetae]